MLSSFFTVDLFPYTTSQDSWYKRLYKMVCVYVHSMTPITVQLYRGVRKWKRSIFKKRRQLQNIIYLWSPTTVYTKSVMCEGVEGDFWIVKIFCWLNPGRVLNLRYSHQSSLRYAEWFIFLFFVKKQYFKSFSFLFTAATVI